MDDLIDALIQDLKENATKSKVEMDRACDQMMRDLHTKNPELMKATELSQTIPHRQIGITTVAEVRKAGGDVVRTAGRSPYHATLTGLTPEQVSKLLTPTVSNPGRERK